MYKSASEEDRARLRQIDRDTHRDRDRDRQIQTEKRRGAQWQAHRNAGNECQKETHTYSATETWKHTAMRVVSITKSKHCSQSKHELFSPVISISALVRLSIIYRKVSCNPVLSAPAQPNPVFSSLFWHSPSQSKTRPLHAILLSTVYSHQVQCWKIKSAQSKTVRIMLLSSDQSKPVLTSLNQLRPV